ncbi:MAG: glycosyltransferase [Lachnospiraceae bacterium]|nr:glycosyltransferase [Lachnospiraceae bacterium]
MDEHLICFIICVTDVLRQEECLTYLNALEVPDGYATDVITIEGADSVCAAYNAAMQSSNAKYKVYLRQEIFLRDRRFIASMLQAFDDPAIGMIGLVGTEQLSEDGVLRNGKLVGTFTAREMNPDGRMYVPEVLGEGIREVMAVDGRLIATQQDLPWREDLFRGQDFFDVSQSLEFRKAGYRVAVAAQTSGGYFFDNDDLQPPVEEEDRKRFLEAYGKQIFTDGQPRKRVLYPNMQTISTWNIPYALTLAGVETVLIEFFGTAENKAEKDIDQVSGSIRELHADAVMTHDFFAPVAVACEENHVPYISWIYDSIQVALYDESALLPGNYIFDFDRLQEQDTKNRGAAYVRHMALAGNVHSMDRLVIEEEDEKRLSCDVSFIGSLYSDRDYQIPMDRLSERAASEVRGLLERQLNRWDGEVRFIGRLSDETIDELVAMQREDVPEYRFIGKRSFIEQTYFSRGITHLERVEMMRRLGETGWDVRLYTKEKDQKTVIPGVRVEKGLEYDKEVPKAYYLSKINLNITLPSIRSGVPLRVFDIMAAGGFMLTNYQPEIDELFVVGRDLEVYHSFDEMVDKVNYYLRHEKERLQITLNGHRRVREEYSYGKRVGSILDMVSEDLVKKGRPALR